MQILVAIIAFKLNFSSHRRVLKRFSLSSSLTKRENPYIATMYLKVIMRRDHKSHIGNPSRSAFTLILMRKPPGLLVTKLSLVSKPLKKVIPKKTVLDSPYGFPISRMRSS